MKRGANDPSHHSFNGHTRRALGTALAAWRMWEGGEAWMVGKKEKKTKNGCEVQHMCVRVWMGWVGVGLGVGV